MTFGMHMFIQLWKSFPEELKTTQQKMIYTNIMEDLFVALQMQKVWKMSCILQNLHFAHTPYNKN